MHQPTLNSFQELRKLDGGPPFGAAAIPAPVGVTAEAPAAAPPDAAPQPPAAPLAAGGPRAAGGTAADCLPPHLFRCPLGKSSSSLHTAPQRRRPTSRRATQPFLGFVSICALGCVCVTLRVFWVHAFFGLFACALFFLVLNASGVAGENIAWLCFFFFFFARVQASWS